MPPRATKDRKLGDQELQELKTETINPALSGDWVEFGDGDQLRRAQIRFLPIAIEQEVVKALGPHLHLLEDLGDIGEDMAAFARFAARAAEPLVHVVAAAFGQQGVTADWLMHHASGRQLVEALLAQMRKQGLQDLLGKLSRKGVQSG